MSGWLDLTQLGLAPNQKHQAFLGAPKIVHCGLRTITRCLVDAYVPVLVTRSERQIMGVSCTCCNIQLRLYVERLTSIKRTLYRSCAQNLPKIGQLYLARRSPLSNRLLEQLTMRSKFAFGLSSHSLFGRGIGPL